MPNMRQTDYLSTLQRMYKDAKMLCDNKSTIIVVIWQDTCWNVL